MNNHIKCQDLFTFESVFVKNIFTHFEYPWEIIPHLRNIIESIIANGIRGYERLGDGILIGRDVRIATGAHIEAPSIIGDGCEIRHGAFIRGSALLCDGCVIGNSSEVKNSILMDGAQAPHFNYVGDSILGKRAHLGAGAICSNLRSDGKSVPIKSASGTIKTGMRKLGAILGDDAEIGCGAVLTPGTVIGKNTVVYPLTLARGVYPSDSIVKDTHTAVKRV